MENEKLTMLPVSAIYPHPDNPRKDVGDVTELADSIKKRGIHPLFDEIKELEEQRKAL